MHKPPRVTHNNKQTMLGLALNTNSDQFKGLIEMIEK